MSSSNILSALTDTNAGITLALEIGGQLVPLAKGLVSEIKKIGIGTDTEEYQLLITADASELDAIAKLSLDDLAAINAELTKLGVAPVVPIASGSSSDASPAPSPNASSSGPSLVGGSPAAGATSAATADAGVAAASSAVGEVGDHGAVGDLGTNTPAAKP